MKTRPSIPATMAFTLIELLVVLAVIALLAALLLPAYSGPGSYRVYCMSNQKQVALGYSMWQQDNGGKFPVQVAVSNGGTMELAGDGHPAAQFHPMFEYIKSFQVYVCPTDQTRQPPVSYEAFRDSNTSYFFNVDATNASQYRVLMGDRHLVANGEPVQPGLFVFTRHTDWGWTRELHPKRTKQPSGGMSFTDGHAEFVTETNLNLIFRRQGLAVERLAVP